MTHEAADVHPAERWLSIQQVCERYGVSRRTVYYWMAAGRVRYRHLPGGSRRILEADLLREPEGLRGRA